MRIEELDYELPTELIAQTPLEPRDAARLLVFRRSSGSVEDRRFADLPGLLAPGDVLVRNDTRVIPARTHFRRETGGRLEVLFLEQVGDSPSAIGLRRSATVDEATLVEAAGGPGDEQPRGGELWEVLVRGRPRLGEVLRLAPDVAAGRAAGERRRDDADWRLRVHERLGDGRWLVRSLSAEPVLERLEAVGETPLPPYIRRRLTRGERYQTVYARVLGSAAAPTAGLHFTAELDRRLAERGVAVESLTLHVGLGTFQPLTADEVEAHELHSEPYALERRVWERVAEAKREGRRVIAVGTTMTRLLETLARVPQTAAALSGTRAVAAGSRIEVALQGSLLKGRTGLFITPGFSFSVVDSLLTNFHLPRTSLLALVMAFCGVEETRRLYRHAIERSYRFYSLGDAMLAL